MATKKLSEYKGAIGQITKVNSTSMVENLNAQMVDGCIVGISPTQIIRNYQIPAQATLISKGYLRSDYAASGSPTPVYLKALTDYLLDIEPNRGIVIASVTPNSEGIVILHKYATQETNYTTGLYLTTSNECYSFGYFRGEFNCYRLRLSELGEKLTVSLQSSDSQAVSGGGYSSILALEKGGLPHESEETIGCAKSGTGHDYQSEPIHGCTFRFRIIAENKRLSDSDGRLRVSRRFKQLLYGRRVGFIRQYESGNSEYSGIKLWKSNLNEDRWKGYISTCIDSITKSLCKDEKWRCKLDGLGSDWSLIARKGVVA